MPPPPRCPRCGYDQSGLVATWPAVGACPLVSPCSECGFDVSWPRVFRPTLHRIPWFFEHAQGIPGLLIAAWQTWFRVALTPRRFWNTIETARPDGSIRIAAWPVVLASSLQVAMWLLWSFVSRGYPGKRIHAEELQSFVDHFGYPLYGRDPYQLWRVDQHWLPAWPTSWLALIGGSLTWPVILTLLARRPMLSRSDRWSLVRATIYSQWVVLLPWFACAAAIVVAIFRPRRVRAFVDNHESTTLPDFAAATLFLWLAYWWLVVIRTHWRAKHVYAVWLTALTGACVAAYLCEQAWMIVLMNRP